MSAVLPAAAIKPVAPSLIQPADYDRTRYIGSSDIAAIMGVSPYRSRLDCYLDKVEPETRDTTESIPMRRGRLLEPYIADLIREETGLEIVHRNRRFRDAQTPYFAAEIDAEYREAGRLRNIEIKTVSPFASKEWGEPGTDFMPFSYLLQIQWGMLVTGRDDCRAFALIGMDDFRSYEIARDDEIIGVMRQQAREFWNVYVKTHTPPPIDPHHGRVLDTLKRQYPGTNGQSMTASPTIEHWYSVLRQSQEKTKLYESAVEAAKAHLVAEMGEAAQLVFADGQAMKRAKRQRKGYTVEALEYMDIRIAKAGKEKGE